MNEKNRESRKARQGPSLLDEVLERRIALYVLAAGATLAGGAGAAQAKVVFTPSNVVLNDYSSGGYANLNIDINNDGTIDFYVSVQSTTTFGSSSSVRRGLRHRPQQESRITHFSALSVFGGHEGHQSQGQILRADVPGDFVAALPNGTEVEKNPHFISQGHMAFYKSGSGGRKSGGPFVNVTQRFLGVRFLINGQVHYGWIGFRSVSLAGNAVADASGHWTGGKITATLLGWAYETEPNTPIIAGSGQGAVFPPSAELRSAGPENVPFVRAAEPTSLELLAAGHVAVADWRRRATA